MALLVIKSSELLAVGDGPAKLSAAPAGHGGADEPRLGASAGHGAKGRRLDDWIPVELDRRLRQGGPGWLLVRRRRDGELAVSACFGLAVTSLVGLVRVAGPVRRLRRRLQAGTGLCGLDEPCWPTGSWWPRSPSTPATRPRWGSSR